MIERILSQLSFVTAWNQALLPVQQ
jgi:hypothetical protein